MREHDDVRELEYVDDVEDGREARTLPGGDELALGPLSTRGEIGDSSNGQIGSTGTICARRVSLEPDNTARAPKPIGGNWVRMRALRYNCIPTERGGETVRGSHQYDQLNDSAF